MKPILLCIPGFLGSPEDFEILKKPILTSSYDIFAIDLWKDPRYRAAETYAEFVHTFHKHLVELKTIKPITALGYSLGGRLLLHSLISQETLIDRALLISVNPGLQTPAERESRKHSDAIWAEKLLRLPWQDFLREWNSQPVFKGTHSQNKMISGDQFLKGLKSWSLGEQEDLRFKIPKIKTPTLWLAGENDHKFVSMTQELGVNHKIIPGAGHRVFLDQPDEVIQQILTLTISG